MIWYSNTSESADYAEIVNNDKYKVHPNGSLSILDVKYEDEGTYMMEITNSNGTTSVEIEMAITQRSGI